MHTDFYLVFPRFPKVREACRIFFCSSSTWEARKDQQDTSRKGCHHMGYHLPPLPYSFFYPVVFPSETRGFADPNQIYPRGNGAASRLFGGFQKRPEPGTYSGTCSEQAVQPSSNILEPAFCKSWNALELSYACFFLRIQVLNFGIYCGIESSGCYPTLVVGTG